MTKIVSDDDHIKAVVDAGAISHFGEIAHIREEGWEDCFNHLDIEDQLFLGDCKFVDLPDGSKGALILVRVEDFDDEYYEDEED